MKGEPTNVTLLLRLPLFLQMQLSIWTCVAARLNPYVCLKHQYVSDFLADLLTSENEYEDLYTLREIMENQVLSSVSALQSRKSTISGLNHLFFEQTYRRMVWGYSGTQTKYDKAHRD